MRIAELGLVRRTPLFVEMTDSDFHNLVATAVSQHFPAHSLIISEGERPAILHVLIEGHVALLAQHKARQTTIDIVEPVAPIMLGAVVLDEACLNSAKTLTGTQTIAIPAKSVRDCFDRNNEFARAVCRELARRHRSAIKTLKGEKLRTGPERLAGWLIFANRSQGDTGNIILRFDKRTLASRLGMTPESLSRAFSHLSAYGVVTSGRKILVQNPDSLQEIAQHNLLMDDG